jgi:hypothetical protein
MESLPVYDALQSRLLIKNLPSNPSEFAGLWSLAKLLQCLDVVEQSFLISFAEIEDIFAALMAISGCFRVQWRNAGAQRLRQFVHSVHSAPRQMTS